MKQQAILLPALLSTLLSPAWASSGAPGDTPPAALYGTYQGAACPPGNTDCLLMSPRDRATVTRTPSGPAVSLRIIFDHGTVCEISGPAAWKAGQLVLQKEGLTQDKPCRLFMDVSDQRLSVKDQDYVCRQLYCGNGGSFSGATFKHR